MNKVFQITTLGCKVNQAESESIAAALSRQNGWEYSSGGTTAGLCIINTCAVTGRAEMQSRQAVRKAVRDNPGAEILVTGCCAQRDPAAFAEIPGVTCVVGQAGKHRIPEMINNSWKGGAERISCTESGIICRGIENSRRFYPMPAPAAGLRSRPFLKIQDGCDAFCTYCIVPHTRGRSRSLESECVLSEFRQLIKSGAGEIVLSGIHIGKYGQELTPRTDLAGLLRLLESIEGNWRIRLSSIEPADLNDELLDIVAGSDRICRHFHLPLQSGDSEILKKMHRSYKPETFAGLVKKIRTRLADAAIGADVMAGFPGETSRAFSRTVRLIEDLPLTYLHVFPYSPRPGTPAARLDGQIPSAEIKQRCRTLRELGKKKKRNFLSSMVGKTLDVVMETRGEPGRLPAKGISSNYAAVILENGYGVEETRTQCRIVGVDADRALFGSPGRNSAKKPAARKIRTSAAV